jgi:putative ABC transport system permease protein
MIHHYFKLAKRALLKNRYYSFINIFGLVFGMLSALIIAKYIGGSLQVDRHHEKKNSIYSVTQEESIHTTPEKTSNLTYRGVGELLNQYPEVVHVTRYSYHVGSLIIAERDSGKHVSFFENTIFSVDADFLKIFTFPLRYGDSETALSKPNSVIITRAASERYFGNSDPIGQSLTVRVPWGHETTYEVTGVTEDVFERSQFKFDFLTTNGRADPSETWLVPDCLTYFLLEENTDIDNLSQKLTGALKDVPELKSSNRTVTVSLERLGDAHLSTTEYLLLAIGIFIVIISWINYINQIIAQSYLRVKEISILRVLGATRVNLKKQFIAESSLICVTSLALIIIIYLIIEPNLQSFTNGHLLPLLGDPTLINSVFLSVFSLGAILAAAIPAVILSSPHVGTTLQHAYGKIGGIGLRQMLVIVQFSVSTILLISVFVISDQLEYINNEEKGIDMENVLIVQAPIAKDTTWNVKREKIALFKEKCAELPFVKQVSSSTTVPSEEYRQETFLSLQGSSTKSMVHQNGVDDHFFDLYAVKFVAGQNFIHDANWKNRSSIILNESAARTLGIVDFNKISNTKIVDHESNEVYELVGIVKDYHQTSLKYQMRPIAFKFNIARGHFSLRIDRIGQQSSEFEKKLSSIRQLWEQAYPDAPFDYYFLDAKFSAQDNEDYYFGKLFNYFTILSIIISCMGLFGLSLLISTKRQREIGVRKVFGATSLNILATFLKGYARPLSVAIVIGSPVAYLLMNMWLENFAYKIEIGFGIMSLSWLCLTLIFLLSVSYHTIKSSLTNPAKILKY